MARSPGPDDILRMQEEALARMEKARARADRPPTVFLLPPDRPLIKQPRALRPRPPTPPFKRLVQERVRRRKWAEEHPGEVGQPGRAAAVLQDKRRSSLVACSRRTYRAYPAAAHASALATQVVVLADLPPQLSGAPDHRRVGNVAAALLGV